MRGTVADTSMMEAVSEDVAGHLLDRWRGGDQDETGWFRLLRAPMTRAAWGGIQRMTGHPPNDDDVGEVVYKAFREFVALDPTGITSPVGLACRIAFRRGQDMGRALNRRREFPDSDAVAVERDRDPPPTPEDQVLEAERAAGRERMQAFALEAVLKRHDWVSRRGRPARAVSREPGCGGVCPPPEVDLGSDLDV
jgi:hypothetical protein